MQCFDQITRVDGHVPSDRVQFAHTNLCDRPHPHIDSPGLFLSLDPRPAAHSFRSVRIVLPLCAGSGMPHSDRPNAVNDGYNH